MSTGMINGFAVNGTATARWIKSATVAASMALVAFACDATLVRGAAASASTRTTAAIAATRVKLGAASAATAAQGYLLPRYVAGGRAAVTTRCTSLAACERLVTAQASGSAATRGYAIAESEIGASEFTAHIEIAATPLRVRPGASILAARASGAVSGVAYGPALAATLRSGARAEASIKLYGETFTRHDGYVEGRYGLASAAVRVTYLERAVRAGTTLGIAATASRTRPAQALLRTRLTGAVSFKGIVFAEATGAMALSAHVPALRVYPSAATGVATSVCVVALPQVHRLGAVNAATHSAGVAPYRLTLAGRADFALHGSASATGTRAHPGQVAAQATLTADMRLGRSNPSLAYLSARGSLTSASRAVLQGAVQATCGARQGTLTTGQQWRGAVVTLARIQPFIPVIGVSRILGRATATTTLATSARGSHVAAAAVNATATLTGQAVGIARGDLNAPPSRSMIVPPESRALFVPAEDRTMRVPA